jgi:DNA end-binding protein Ku
LDGAFAQPSCLSNEDIIKGYKVDTDRYLEVSKEELENISLESTRTIEIDEFVPRKEIDDLYPVIRDKVALGRVVLTSREHVIALEARDKGLMGCCSAILTKCETRQNTSTRSRT